MMAIAQEAALAMMQRDMAGRTIGCGLLQRLERESVYDSAPNRVTYIAVAVDTSV